jgi:hypothetical protein
MNFKSNKSGVPAEITLETLDGVDLTFMLDESIEQYQIKLIKVKDGSYKVGCVKEWIDGENMEDEILLDKRLYNSKEADKQVEMWAKKLDLKIWDFTDDYYERKGK